MNFEQILNVTSVAFIEIRSIVSSIDYTALVEQTLDFIKYYVAVLVSQSYLSSPISFTELQQSLLTVFLVIIAINLLLIAFYWNKYGRVITDRFIRPSTLKEIEELKLSVAKLKLPYEHTPRI